MARHLIPQNELELHERADFCICRPKPRIDHAGDILWIHNALNFEADIQREAQAILEATSVRLWDAADKKGLKVQVIPFASNKPIHEPGNTPRFNFPQPPEEMA